MKFQYLRDPLFLFCFTVYFVNRLLVKKLLSDGFFHDYFNDFICIPFWVPIMLFAMRKLGLRGDDRPPRSYEIIIPLLLWSVFFELLLPQVTFFKHLAFTDANDILFYTLGALGASVFWQKWYRDKK